jgi:hypothetical protein
MCAHFQDGEPWQKVLGPVFIYLNSAPPGMPLSALWEDAKRQVRLLKPINPVALPFYMLPVCHLLGGELCFTRAQVLHFLILWFVHVGPSHTRGLIGIGSMCRHGQKSGHGLIVGLNLLTSRKHQNVALCQDIFWFMIGAISNAKSPRIHNVALRGTFFYCCHTVSLFASILLQAYGCP